MIRLVHGDLTVGRSLNASVRQALRQEGLVAGGRLEVSIRRICRRLLSTQALAVLFGTIPLPAAESFYPQPGGDWRHRPAKVWASSGNVKGLTEGKTVHWNPSRGSRHHLEVHLGHNPSRQRNGYGPGRTLVVFEIDPQAEVELWSRRSPQQKWVKQKSFTTGPFLNKAELNAQQGLHWQLVFHTDSTVKVRVRNLGLFRPDSAGPNDYWLTLGASIQNQSMNQDCFSKQMKSLYPHADPILFNLGVRGWGTGDLLSSLPAILQEHPYSTYICLHIGGNNISSARPYPGGAGLLEKELRQIVAMLQDAGKVVFLARVSYRAYPPPNAVPPEGNGSLPYVEEIYMPLKKDCCDPAAGTSRSQLVLDMYGFIKNNPKYLSDDGVHLTPTGENQWCRFWASETGRLLYRGAGQARAFGPELRVFSKTASLKLQPPWKPTPKIPVDLTILNYNNHQIMSLELTDYKERQWDMKNGKGVRVAPGLYWLEWRRNDKILMNRLRVYP